MFQQPAWLPREADFALSLISVHPWVTLVNQPGLASVSTYANPELALAIRQADPRR